MGGTGVIDNFLGTFTQYIDSGFGLVQGDVRWLAGVLIGIDITLAGLFWALAPDEDVLARLIRKTLYIGVFAFIIGNFNTLAQIIYNSFAGLGIEAGGGTISTAQLLQPGKLAQVGIDAGKPILTSISGMMGFTSVFENLVQIIILLVAWMIVIISFFIMAIQLFVSLIEFKLTTLAGFVLVPFGLFGRTAFLAEKVLGNVVSSGVKILVLAVIVGIGQQIFGQFTNGFNDPPTISDALTLILASLALLALTIFGPGIANGLISGGPQLGAGAAIGTGLAVAGVGAAGVGLAAAGVGAVGAAAGVAAGAARGGAALAGAATTAYRAGGLSGVAEAAASSAANTAMSPLRRAAASMRESFAAGSRSAAAGPAGSGESTASGAGADSSSPPAWARRMRRNQAISQGASAAHRAIQSGDHPSGGTGVDLSEGE
jgi:type IV secretion system protein TrbL